jgi:hypothetical protein
MTEQEYRDEVYTEAKDIKTIDSLSAFIKKLGNHKHDYGTIVYACSAAMKAAFHTFNACPQGGITGFQAGCLMWEMVKEFGSFSEGPLRIQDFDNLRFPQYDERWTVTISPESAKVLRERAAKVSGAHPNVQQRNDEIAAGRFPSFVTVKEES